jgi:steroid delta-isomerase-like uncharacterized protein
MKIAIEQYGILKPPFGGFCVVIIPVVCRSSKLLKLRAFISSVRTHHYLANQFERSPSMSSESNKALARRFFDEVCNGSKPAVAHEIFAPGFVYHEPPSISPGGSGPEAMAQEAANYYQAMSDAQWVVHDVIAGENDMVTVRWTGQGTHDGSLAGIPPTGKQVSVEALTLFRIDGGKIVELWDCWDALGLLQQVGVIPKMG